MKNDQTDPLSRAQEALDEFSHRETNYSEIQTTLADVLDRARMATHADAGMIFLVENGELAFTLAQNDTLFPSDPNHKFFYIDAHFPLDTTSVAGYVATTKTTVNLANVDDQKDPLPFSCNFFLDRTTGYKTQSVLTLPIMNHKEEVIGVLQLLNCKKEGTIIPFSKEMEDVVKDIIQSAARTLEKRLGLKHQELRRQLHLYESLLDAIPNPIFAKNGDARFCFFNKAYEQFFNMNREERLGKSVLDLDYLPVEARTRYQKEDLASIKTGSTVHYETEYDTVEGPRNALYWSKGIAVLETGEKALIGQIVDISHLKKLERELAAKIAELEEARDELNRLCRIDPLTNLANRIYFQEQIASHIQFAKRYRQPFSIIMADIDFFKNVNDTYGHEVGDDVLKGVSQLLADSSRKGDLAARYGGEEFIIILPMAKLDAALLAAERIRKGVEELSLLPDGKKVTLSLGVAEYQDGEAMKDLIKRADDALYDAKHKGRNQVCS